MMSIPFDHSCRFPSLPVRYQGNGFLIRRSQVRSLPGVPKIIQDSVTFWILFSSGVHTGDYLPEDSSRSCQVKALSSASVTTLYLLKTLIVLSPLKPIILKKSFPASLKLLIAQWRRSWNLISCIPARSHAERKDFLTSSIGFPFLRKTRLLEMLLRTFASVS